jgi:hypothetical protein
MKDRHEAYGRANGMTTAEIAADWAQVEADMAEIAEQEDKESGLGSDHWKADGSPRCPLEHDVAPENCGNCERNCPHNEISWLRVPRSEWDVLDGYEPLEDDSDPTLI